MRYPIKQRGPLAILFVGLALLFALATAVQINRTMSLLADGLDESGHLLIGQIYGQMREALNGAKGDPAAVLAHDARLRDFLASAQTFGRGVVYARIAAPNGGMITGSARSDSPESPPPFDTLQTPIRSIWPPERIAALWSGRTFQMTRAVTINDKPFAEIQVGLSTGFIADEAKRDAARILAIGGAGIALSLLGAIIIARPLRKTAPVMLSPADRVPESRADSTQAAGSGNAMAALAERFDELSKRIRQSGDPSRRARARLMRVLRSIGDGMLLLDSAGVILFANDEAQGRIGLPAGGLAEGKPLAAFIGHNSALARLIETARSSGAEMRDVAVELEGGAIGRLLVSIFTLGHGPEPPGMLVVMRDLELVREVDATIRHADQLARVGGLIAGIAGRIRDPLIAIGAQLEQAGREAARGLPIDRKIERLHGEVDRLERAVDALLLFMRPARLELTSVPINALLAETARAAVRPGIRLDYRLDNTLGEVMADRALIAEAFYNVIANAVEAMPAGGRLTIASSRQGGRLAEIAITDTGPGITPENLKRVFNPFFTTKKRPGVGLSLALRAVELHHGTIDVTSTVGGGTTVRIRLPLAGGRGGVISLRSA